MTKLALSIIGSSPIPTPVGLRSEFNSVGSVLSEFFNVGFYIAGFLMVFWVFWGVFQYIFARGNKDALSKARSRITWAIVGFILIGFMFALSQYLSNVFPQSLPGGVKNITQPTP